MTKLGGWAAGLIGMAAVVLPGAGSAQAASLDDMKACGAVGSTAVRLACFDAAAKGIQKGDIAACAKVSSDSVRLACFDAASGSTAKAPGTAPASAARQEMDRLDAEMRAREAAMKARIEELQRKAAEVERQAAEIERKSAVARKQTAEPADPEEAFGDKYLDEDSKNSAERNFGDRKAESNDALTAENYGESAKDKDEEDGELDRIAIEITKFDKGPYGKIRVTLANGQVWKQIDSTRARWDKDGKNVAHIRRAFLGSFLMTINDEGAALRVRRVK